jgi:hypothetical protein
MKRTLVVKPADLAPYEDNHEFQEIRKELKAAIPCLTEDMDIPIRRWFGLPSVTVNWKTSMLIAAYPMEDAWLIFIRVVVNAVTRNPEVTLSSDLLEEFQKFSRLGPVDEVEDKVRLLNLLNLAIVAIWEVSKIASINEKKAQDKDLEYLLKDYEKGDDE